MILKQSACADCFCDNAERKDVKMSNTANIKDAVYLIDDDSLLGWGNLRTSWDYEGDGQGPKAPRQKEYWLLNSDKDGEVFVRRDCNKFEGGKMTFEMLFDNMSGDGLYVSFGSREDSFLKLYTKGEALYSGNNKVADLSYGKHYIKVYMDLASSKAKINLDARNCGEFDFDKNAFTYSCLKIGYGEKDKGAAGIYFCKLYVNYLANDACLNRYVGEMPDEYTVKATKGATVTSDVRVAGKEEYTYISRNKKGAKTVTTRSFDKASGNVVFEIMYLMTESKGKVKIALCKGNKDIVSVYDEGEELHCYCGCALRKHHLNVWQTLRIYADTDKGCATIWLNGKKTKTVDFESPAKFLDNFKVTYEADEKSSLMFSDILLWIKPEEPEDYVPVPVIPKKKNGHIVGMNICSLWREGSHLGWDCITPYDDIKPVLGFYDEGLPETSDWEIKYMVEHGIDYELYCWYSTESKAPIKTTHLHHALVDGHFYAKYADMEKFAILWEAANCQHPTCLEDFKGNVVPYWLDYFFSDPRYMTLDNKAVMSCFGVWCVEKDLGGEECVREGLQYLRDEVKKLGYDDLIIMGCHAHPNDLKRLGFDAHHAYHWGKEGYKLETNINSIDINVGFNAVHHVPTVSTGFKNVGWGGDRRPNLSCQDMYTALKYCVDEVLPKNEKGTWKAKTLHLSTWNEYGEGTYIMPSGLNGFGYLDAVRKAVCVDEPHEDVVPTEEQKARIGYLHLPDRYRLQRTKYDVRPRPTEDKAVAKITFKTKADLNRWKYTNMTDVEIKDGRLCGKATAEYPEMELKSAQFDASQIAYAKIVCTNRHGSAENPDVLYIMPSNRPEKNYSRADHASYSVWCNSPEVKEYTVDLDVKPVWGGTINGLKIIPVIKGSFEIESITFYAGAPHVCMYKKDGEQMFFGDYLPVINGEVFVPYDPWSGIVETVGYKYEWFKEQGRLELWKGDDRVTVVVGQPYAVKNGESFTLVKPAFLKDGLPAIALSDAEKLFGFKYERIGNKIFAK